MDKGVDSEAAQNADFSLIRYAQCWEDADVLLEALDIQQGDVCLSVASAGDNALAMLARDPAKVIAVDLSAAQLACLELRVAAYRELEQSELLELMGSRESERRDELYRRCRAQLGSEGRGFWDRRGDEIRAGIGGAGKFERYFKTFRKRVLPLVHGRKKVENLLEDQDSEGRQVFYEKKWDTWRWRLMFKIFFSRWVMGRAGRDPSFFKYAKGSVASQILGRAKHALTALNPADNPYLQWILTGTHRAALPFALRSENFDKIRNNLDRLEWRQDSLEGALEKVGGGSVQRFNLSDIFEYISEDNMRAILKSIVEKGSSGSRIAYWNMVVPRSRPEDMAGEIRSLEEVADALHLKDKAFFYSRFVVEEVI